MRVLVFLNSLSLGGTEKAALVWSRMLSKTDQIQSVRVVSLADGPRKNQFEEQNIPVHVCTNSNGFSEMISELENCDVIHSHCPGYHHSGDILGAALQKIGRKIPVVQTNIFGKLENPQENEWTDFRCFISWTSCVQAANRAQMALDLEFFRHQSVAVYPVVDPFETVSELILSSEAAAFRKDLGLSPADVLFGRFSRPEPNKWSPLAVQAFLRAKQQDTRLRLLLREPPPKVAKNLITAGKAVWGGYSKPSDSAPIVLLPATPDPHELCVSQMACDAILHTSSIGESFGYGIAEPMALGKPVITNSVPWHDQAQIELVRHGECGFIASTVPSMKAAILKIGESAAQRAACGMAARQRILKVANPVRSTDRIQMALRCALKGRDNPSALGDMNNAINTAKCLNKHQWGHFFEESFWLHTKNAKTRFFRWQRLLRNKPG
jgi:glycosyltransferase involved in cell wall biosynthesis